MELFHVGKFGIFGTRTPPVFRAGTDNRVNSAPLGSSLNSPNSGIGLFFADSGFFDGKNRVFWRIGSKPSFYGGF